MLGGILTAFFFGGRASFTGLAAVSAAVLIWPDVIDTPGLRLSFGANVGAAVIVLMFGVEYRRQRRIQTACRHRYALKTERLRGMIEKLSVSNAELENFAGVAAHELRQPLTTFSSYLNLMQFTCGHSLPGPAQEIMPTLIQTSERMRGLLESLLNYARLNAALGERKIVRLEESVRQASLFLQQEIRQTGTRITHDPLPEILGDELLIQQLFMNLFSNAIKFRKDDTPAIHVSAQKKDRAWVISVRDNGIGFTEKNHQDIFKIFKRLHARKKYPGNGIGLAICKKIVQLHDGKISADETCREGALFKLEFPVPPDAL